MPGFELNESALIPTRSGVIDKLAAWLCEVTEYEVPDNVRVIGRRCILDTLGVAIAGAAMPATSSMTRTLGIVSAADAGYCQLVTAAGATNPLAAALINGTAAHALDFDDNSYAGFVHGSAVIVTAALAVAQHQNASGSDFLQAVILGSEALYAVGAGFQTAMYEKGWWTTGLLGPLGACAAACYLLRMNQSQIRSAIGLAMVSSGGAKAAFGSDAKAIGAGRAAHLGVISAYMAHSGATGPADLFEHEYGIVNLLNEGKFNIEPMSSIGKSWKLISPGIDIKCMPTCLSSHAAVDAAIDVIKEEKINWNEIDEVLCETSPVVIKNLIYEIPENRQQAQFSMHYALAISIIYGKFNPEHFQPEYLHDDSVRWLMQRIKMKPGSKWQESAFLAAYPEGAEISIRTRGGKICLKFLGHPHGSAQNPLSDEELNAKFMGCTKNIIGEGKASALKDQVWSVEKLNQIRNLLPRSTSDNISR